MSLRLPGSLYRKVFDNASVFKGRYVIGWFLNGDASLGPMVGTVASKKSFHEAVDRNRAKRLMRESFRLLAKEGRIPAGAMWIFIARASMKGRSCPEVKKDVEKVLQKCARQSPSS